MTEQPLDLRRIWAAIRHDRTAFLACLAAAIVGALVFTVAKPPAYSARALVLLPASSVDSSGEPSRDIATQVRIASSADVVQIAANKLKSKPRVADLVKHVRVSAPTPDILQINARASSRGGAIEIANAVANAYVVYTERGATQDLDRVVGALQGQAKSLSEQVAKLQSRIDDTASELARLTSGTPEATTRAALLNSLRTQQADATAQLGDINQRVSELQVNNAVADSATRILERATTARSSALFIALRNFLIALLLGLLVGTMTALFRDGRDRSLRRRDDIASAAGVPAVASIMTGSARSAEEWLALISTYEPSVDESWGLRRTLRQLVTAHDSGPARATIVCFDGDDAALAVAPQLAAFSARAGVRTVLVVDHAGATREPVIPNLWLLDPESAATGPDQNAPQLLVDVVVTGDLRLATRNKEHNVTTLLAVSAGFATSDAITSIALAATEASRPLFGVIIANPLVDDDSSGRITQPVGTDRPRLPTRITGLARGSR
jgi:capsular polysaccharide biosynthesis protein